LKERWKNGFELKEMWRNNYELKVRWRSDYELKKMVYMVLPFSLVVSS